MQSLAMPAAMLLLALAAGPAAAQSGAGQSGTDAPTPDLSWITGHWCGESRGRSIDEVWLAEAGGELIGMSRTVDGARVESFEFMRIVDVDGDATSFHAQPGGAPPTVFTIEARGDGWIRFANVAHDFPNRIEYRRDGDRLRAWIAGPGADGAEMRIPFEYGACGS